FARDARGTAHEHRIGLCNGLRQLIAREPRLVHEIESRILRQRGERAPLDGVRDEHLVAGAHVSTVASSASSASSSATVWSPMCPMRIVASFNSPYPDAIVYPRAVSA